MTSGGIFLLQGDELIEMREQAYDSEKVLQELLEKYPRLLASEQSAQITSLPTNTTQEALADGIGPRSTDRSPEDLDPARCRDASQQGTVRAVIVSDQVARPYSERRGFS